MSSQSSVSFAFQADVANTGSLLHLLTGKALKALSDGGVDFYSVVVAITLGKGFEVRNSLGNTVPAHVKSKRGIQSVLSKILSIGWGQPELAIAMTQTKAGVNALLLIDAIAYGSTYYQAAECFSNLLSLRGCEADKLPNVDVLKHMIGYLAPFLLDLGFSRVVAHITTTATRAINLNNCGHDECLERLARAGDASSVAGAINQLMLTSQRKESNYMPTRMRGAWFSAFASHVLGMAVELRLDNAIIWQSAGSNGVAIFELGEYQADDSHFQAIIGQRVTIIELPDPKDQDSMLDSCLPIDMAFASLIAREPKIDILIQQDIRRAIYRLSLKMLKQSLEQARMMRPWGYWNFETSMALKETLNAFGFENAIFDSVDNQPPTEEMPNAIHSINALGLEAYDRLRSACGSHGDNTPENRIRSPDFHINVEPHFYTTYLRPGRKYECDCSLLCGYVNRLIVGFAYSAIYLAQCRFDASQLSIHPDNLLNQAWRRHFSPHGSQRDEDLLSYIFVLVDNIKVDIGQRMDSHFTLGLSGKSFTVCYTCILSYDCFDNQGRFFSLIPGRASVGGAFRRRIVEKDIHGICAQFSNIPVSTLLASGLSLMPHHAPSESNIFMDVSFDEKIITLSFKVGCEKASAGRIPINRCINFIMKAWGVSCPHEPTSELRVQKDQNLAVVGFGALSSKKGRNKNVTHLIALRGNKLEQLLTFGMLESYEDTHNTGFVFQLTACLKCCIATAKNEGCDLIIMGG